jgi:hypothetical protein
VEKWLTYLREEMPTVAFKCNTQEQRTKLGWKSSKLDKTGNIPQSSDCLGAENLIRLLKNYSRSHEVKIMLFPDNAYACLASVISYLAHKLFIDFYDILIQLFCIIL